ncbi:ProQ/FINO family protein [Thiohalorhabdus sp. Cl-TMA]|uniref:ProQ/FINO family protein n=1 Tax=Thiohalorhabdus methylotrophus TaxID=3242694 RepID=A0ABV4U0E5_9GAMM
MPSWRKIAALRRHVSDPRYLRAVAQGGKRHNLYGLPVGEITEPERGHALAALYGLTEGDPSQQQQEDFVAGVRMVLLKQVAARFGAGVQDETAEVLSGQLLMPDTVEHLAISLLQCPRVENWRSALDAATSEESPSDEPIVPKWLK